MANTHAHLQLVPLYPVVSPIALRSRRRRDVNRAVQDGLLVIAGVAVGLAIPLVAQGQLARVLLALAFFASLALTVLLSAALGGWVYEWALRKRVDRAALELHAELAQQPEKEYRI